MFKIHPIENYEVAKSIYSTLKEDELLFGVNEEGHFTGFGVSCIINDAIFIRRIEANAPDARFLLFADMLNYADRRGLKKAVCEDKSLKDICDRMGFNNDLAVNLEGFFKPGAHCSHE
ncbi:MAG: hypothetical protein Q8882_05945 [Bacillota bacterium]|nr:hypothetical protein [Bacillota bacterium]